jgi:transcriptional regulator GlxA family with amidase domain
MPHIKIWVYDGILASGVNGPIDVFTAANAISSGQLRVQGYPAAVLTWSIESLDGKPITTASGQIVRADRAIHAGSKTSAVIVSAPFLADINRFLDEKRQALQPLMSGLHQLHKAGALLATYCTGSFLFAEAGLLDGRMATTHWARAREFNKRFPNVDLRASEVMTEDDGILCSGAVTSYLNLALRLVAKLSGEKQAEMTARTLLIDPNRVSQASYAIMDVENQEEHSDQLVRRARRWMRSHLNESIRVANLARELGTTERTLNRRFKAAFGEAPLRHLQKLRIETAKRLLISDKAASLEAVCSFVGYQDVSTFRLLFKRVTGLSPRDYRRQFAPLSSHKRS